MKPSLCPIILLCFFSVAASSSDEQPSMELLEFLGEWENEQGEKVNPFEFSEVMELTEDKLPEKQPQQQKKQQNHDE